MEEVVEGEEEEHTQLLAPLDCVVFALLSWALTVSVSSTSALTPGSDSPPHSHTPTLCPSPPHQSRLA